MSSDGSGPSSPAAQPVVTVVGIGADGWDGLAEVSRRALMSAGVVVGYPRQLELLPDMVTAGRVQWPSPLRTSVVPLVTEHQEAGLCVLASGDPMWHGIGRTLAEELGAHRLHVLPHPSSVSLACARLGWAVEHTSVVSLVTGPVEQLLRHCHDGAHILVLSRDVTSPASVAEWLRLNGFGASRVSVLPSLTLSDPTVGGLARVRGTAQCWDGEVSDPLNVVAVECHSDRTRPHIGLTPGLPDDLFDHDGQITKREVRALTLSALAPAPGELLWDVGGGSGSVAIEWLRAHPSCSAISVERNTERVGRIQQNATRLGVPELLVVAGRAPQALQGLPAPDAVFIGGGLGVDGLVEGCWNNLRPGGRLVANAVTLESQADLVSWRTRLGGELTQVQIAHADPLGRFTTWRPALPLVQWCVTKPVAAQNPEPAQEQEHQG